MSIPNTPPTDKINPASAQALAIAELAREGVARHRLLEVQPGYAPRLVWPDKTVWSLEGMMTQPERPRGKAQLVDAESFAAYIKAYRGEGTVITGNANETGGSFTALLDYHWPEDDLNHPGRPQWCEHTATMPLEPTPEWTRWMGINGRDLDQRTFAEFLEDNAVDLVVPEGDAGKGLPTRQELMSVASTLQIKTDVKFASSLRLQNGQVQLGYTENIQGGHGTEGALPVPERFAIGIAPFRGTPKYVVTCRLRYRGTGGRAAFVVQIERPHKVVEAVFTDLRAKIEQLTGLRPLVGTITPQVRPNI